MSTIVTARVKCSVVAKWSKELGLGDVEATPSSLFSLQLANGAGANKVEQVLTASGTITASGSVNIDLAGVVTDPGGDVITFTKVKVLQVKNLTEGAGDGIEVGGTFDTYYKAGGDEVVVMPGGVHLGVNPTSDGWAVVADTGDVITLTNPDSVNDQDYEVIVLGETS